MSSTKKAILMILDGWGHGDGTAADVIKSTATPNMDALMANYPCSKLNAAGNDVGLPTGQMGNSEVGHLNIGAGRVMYQDLVKINKSIEDKSLWQNEQLIEAYTYAKENNKKVHLLGLLGDGGVHALTSHLVALAEVATEMGIEDLFIHSLTDGRDTDPRSAYGFMETALDKLSKTNAKVASVLGRYYGMDRDNNWDRLKLAYDLLTKGEGEKSSDVLASIKASYDNGLTDEFIKPIVAVDENQNPLAVIEKGDVVICYNYRTDRLRQMTVAFTQEDHPEAGLKTMDLNWLTMTVYNANFKGIKSIFPKTDIKNTIGEVIEAKGLKQIRTAETEKFAHVTFFFSGGREDEFKGETRILVPSPKVATYDLQPEMSAPAVTEKLVPAIESESADFICVNYANCDMVGHTGIYPAIEKAVQTVDAQVGKVVEAAKAHGYDVIIIADHGNADLALNSDGSMNTAHTLNPVPCIWVTDNNKSEIKDGILADVAPTILSIMGIDIPEEMTGTVLI